MHFDYFPFSCRVCETGFETREALQTHKKTHTEAEFKEFEEKLKTVSFLYFHLHINLLIPFCLLYNSPCHSLIYSLIIFVSFGCVMKIDLQEGKGGGGQRLIIHKQVIRKKGLNIQCKFS